MINIDREYLSVVMEAGYVYMGMKRFKEARELFEGLSALVPESEVPLVALGNVEFCEGKIEKAVHHYTKALKIDPESPFAKVYMGEALFFSGKKDEAVKLLHEVAKSDSGGAGEFAMALMDAIKKGFKPGKQRSVKPVARISSLVSR